MNQLVVQDEVVGTKEVSDRGHVHRVPGREQERVFHPLAARQRLLQLPVEGPLAGGHPRGAHGGAVSVDYRLHVGDRVTDLNIEPKARQYGAKRVSPQHVNLDHLVRHRNLALLVLVIFLRLLLHLVLEGWGRRSHLRLRLLRRGLFLLLVHLLLLLPLLLLFFRALLPFLPRSPPPLRLSLAGNGQYAFITGIARVNASVLFAQRTDELQQLARELEIFERNDPAVCRHEIGDQLRGHPLVKAIFAVCLDAVQRCRKVRLLPGIAGLIEGSVRL